METGSFVYKYEGDGCLTGKFIHDKSESVYVECAKLKEKGLNPADPFEGEYKSVWIETDKSQGEHDLYIKKKPGLLFYELKWEKDQTPVFYGEAMVYNGLLCGWYKKVR